MLLRLGESVRARALLAETLHEAETLVHAGDERPGIRREIAAIHAALGNREQAYMWLDRAIRAGWRLEGLFPSHLFDPLRAEPRFRGMIERMLHQIRRSKEQLDRESVGGQFAR